MSAAQQQQEAQLVALERIREQCERLEGIALQGATTAAKAASQTAEATSRLEGMAVQASTNLGARTQPAACWLQLLRAARPTPWLGMGWGPNLSGAPRRWVLLQRGSKPRLTSAPSAWRASCSQLP
jgi:hypothetical protein